MGWMSKFLLATSVGLAATIGARAQDGAPAIRWHTSLNDAATIARATGKPMLLDFWADWCAACNVMDATVYPDGRVTLALSRIVPVKIDADRKADLVRKYRVEGLPTLVYTDSYGNELYRFMGLLNASDMAQLLAELPNDIERINRLGRIVAEGGGDFASLGALGDELRAARLYRSSNEYYARALRARGARDQAATRGAIAVAMGANHLALKEFAAAAAVFEKFLKDPGAPDLRADAMLGLGRAWLGQGRKDRARPVLEDLVRQHPGGTHHDEAARLLGTF